jgi:hypothetical protein
MSRTVGCSNVAPSIVAGRRSRCLHRSAWSRSRRASQFFMGREWTGVATERRPLQLLALPNCRLLLGLASGEDAARRVQEVALASPRPAEDVGALLSVSVGEVVPFPALLTACSHPSGLALLVVLASFVEVDAQRGRRWIEGSRWSGRADWGRGCWLELAQTLAQRRHGTVAAGGARLDRLLADPEQRAGTLLLVAHPLGGEGGVHFSPASRLPNDRRGLLDGDPLSAALAAALLQVLGSTGRSTFALITRPKPLGATIQVHRVEPTHFAFPSLTLLDASRKRSKRSGPAR